MPGVNVSAQLDRGGVGEGPGLLLRVQPWQEVLTLGMRGREEQMRGLGQLGCLGQTSSSLLQGDGVSPAF